MNLKDKVTVFLISSGEPDYPKSKQALLQQDCQFTFEEIRNVSPMNAAFQQMIDRCRTPFYIQVDGDMVLEPWAIRRMYADFQKPEIEQGPHTRTMNRVAFLTFLLYDVHLRMNIYGVKIYRHDIMSRFPYQSSYSCEVDQSARIQKAGFFAVDCYDSDVLMGRTVNTFGTHSPTWTSERIYNRYRRLAQKWRRFNYGWMKSLPQRFLNDLIADRKGLDFWALVGFIAGTVGPLDEEKEQSFRTADEDWPRLQELFRQI